MRILSACALVVSMTACAEAPSAPPPTDSPVSPARPAAVTPPAATPPQKKTSAALPPDQAALLTRWYQAVGAPRDGEGFGELIVRAAKQQLGKTYFDPPSSDAPEELRVALDTFQCVSLVESSLAVARCLWRGDASEGCFLDEVQQTRYRDGVIDGFASRMHYFSEWMVNNSERGRLEELTGALGGVRRPHELFYMTKHADKYPPLKDEKVRAAIGAIEARLSKTAFWTLGRRELKKAQEQLQTGDVIAIVTSKPGLLISHTGFVLREGKGPPRLLHASSHNKRVLVTGDIASYVSRWPDRQGIMAARPLPPQPTLVRAP